LKNINWNKYYIGYLKIKRLWLLRLNESSKNRIEHDKLTIEQNLEKIKSIDELILVETITEINNGDKK
jgi:hypothetical protein